MVQWGLPMFQLFLAIFVARSSVAVCVSFVLGCSLFCFVLFCVARVRFRSRHVASPPGGQNRRRRQEANPALTIDAPPGR